MAQGEDGSQEKTEDPTDRRLEKAFEEGSMLMPQDTYAVGAWVALAAALPLFYIAMGVMAARDRDILTAIGTREIDVAGLTLAMLAQVGLPLLGMLLVFLVFAVFIGFAQQHFRLQPRPLRASLGNLSPLKGFQRLFGGKALVQTAFNALKLVITAAVFAVLLDGIFDRFRLIAVTSNARIAVSLAFEVALLLGGVGLAILIAFALIDLFVKRMVNIAQLRMTRQELREEMKDTEGRPEVKSKLAELRRKRRSTSTKHPLKTADVMVTNPTHYAVALLYEPGRMAAPIVIAKGTGLVARRLRWLAWRAGIPIVQAPPVARRLFRDVDVDAPIPDDSFAEVAQILVRVYQMRRNATRV